MMGKIKNIDGGRRRLILDDDATTASTKIPVEEGERVLILSAASTASIFELEVGNVGDGDSTGADVEGVEVDGPTEGGGLSSNE